MTAPKTPAEISQRLIQVIDRLHAVDDWEARETKKIREQADRKRGIIKGCSRAGLPLPD